VTKILRFHFSLRFPYIDSQYQFPCTHNAYTLDSNSAHCTHTHTHTRKLTKLQPTLALLHMHLILTLLKHAYTT